MKFVFNNESVLLLWWNEEQIKFIHNLVGKPEGKGPLGRSRYRWKGYIKMDII